MSMIRIENISKSFGSLEVLKNVSLTIEKGERVVIIGESGGGKSVLLRSIDLLEKPEKGAIYIGEDEITRPKADLNNIRRRIGFVHQGFHLFSHLSVLENITLAPIKLLKMNKEQAEEKADKLLKMVGLESKKYSMPDVLSGGQKQRIAIAGVLAMRPQILILDESTSMLDPNGRKEIMAIAKKLNEQGITVINITHNMDEAVLADRIIVLRKGRVAIDGTPKEVFASGLLEACGLTLPPVYALCKSLERKGFVFDSAALTEEELAEGVCRQLK